MTGDDIRSAVQRAGAMLRAARHAVVFTGAGISTPSGIPDFRSKRTGLWERYDPMQVASIGTFRSHPEQFYGWLRPLLRDIWNAQPNAAHYALAELEAAGRVQAVITQNIDDLHQRAGSKQVYEVHGSLRTMTCQRCKVQHSAQIFRQVLSASDELARCPSCGQVVKPDITLFGEMLPARTWSEAERHCQAADLMLVAGSSLEVWPAAHLPQLAVEEGAGLIIINLTPTFLDDRAAALIPLDVAQALPEVARIALQS